MFLRWRLWLGVCVAWWAAAGLSGLPSALAEQAVPGRIWPKAPPESLVRRMLSDIGFPVVLKGVLPEDLTRRWQIRHHPDGSISCFDPASQLRLHATFRPVEDMGVVMETTLVHAGRAPLEISEIWALDWSFQIRAPEDGPFEPLAYREADLWYGSKYWSGPDWTRVGKDWQHPGQQTASVRKFICPEDGKITITGRVRKAHLDGEGVRVMILHGNQPVWQAELEGRDGQGIDPNLTLEVRRGDRIRFVVHKRKDIFCDTTFWDPIITYSPGKRFQASTAFGFKQGEGGWFYEMQTEGQPKTERPTVYLLGPGLIIQPNCLTPDERREFALEGGTSVAVLADGDRSGLVLALLDESSFRITAETNAAGILRMRIGPRSPGSGWTLQPGQSLRLGPIWVDHYQGHWIRGFTELQRYLESESKDSRVEGLRERLLRSWQSVFGGLGPEASEEDKGGSSREQTGIGHAGQEKSIGPALLPELDYWAMIQQEWRREDGLDGGAAHYCRAAAQHLEKAKRLLEDFQPTGPSQRAASWRDELDRLEKLLASAQPPLEEAQRIYYRVRWLKRQIILSNPLMQFGKLLFCKRKPTSYSHLVMQYFGWRARPGGGLFILEKPGYSLACRDILHGRLATGNVLEPRLSYDGQRIVFSYVELAGKSFRPESVDNQTDEGFYHIYEVGVDGTGFRQLTAGPYDDLMPNYLPDGGIVFCSTRRQGYARCFGAQFSRRWHVYTLHRMDADGGNIRTLSWHDTNEWFPTVAPTGEIVYARWDYIDRDAVTHQNLWVCRPDGSNPRALWGNATASPHCAFQAQPIPGTNKFIFTASPHHSITAGSLAIVDPAVAPDGHAGLLRITPHIPFPEAESREIREYYASPWPLSEKYYLVSYSPKPLVWEPGANDPAALGIYYLDIWGNRELIYRDLEIGSENPCPLAARPKPPIVPSVLPAHCPPWGEMVLVDVYQGLGNIPRGTIKSLRIVQIFPKTTHVANSPAIGLAGEENGRAILGVVPVERDGSARFLVPAQKPILFQALDEQGFAYQTMRSITYLQPGEQVTCVGCHEHRRTAPPGKAGDILALRRPASPIDPGSLGGRPFSFMEVVQPILDRHCVRCHDGKKSPAHIDLRGIPDRQFSRSYWSLCGDVNFWGGETNPKNAAKALVPRFGARNLVQVTPPGGMYGARGSRLLRLLQNGHEGVQLTTEELARLAAWIDLNAIFYGVYLPEDQARQLSGQPVPMPEIQ